MVELLRGIGRMLNNMDAKALTSLGVSLALLALVLLLFVLGQHWRAPLGEGALEEFMLGVAHSPWAVLLVIAVFTALALTGFPQFILITVTVIAFGPRDGAVYAWIATMASATATFALGRAMGGAWVRRFAGQRVQKTIRFVSRHGVLASALVRVVPSAPFIVVNAAAGAAAIPLWKFWAGTSVGIIPKILLVATLGSVAAGRGAIQDGVDGLRAFFASWKPSDFALLIAIIVIWLVFLLLVRRIYMRLRREDEEI